MPLLQNHGNICKLKMHSIFQTRPPRRTIWLSTPWCYIIYFTLSCITHIIQTHPKLDRCMIGWHRLAIQSWMVSASTMSLCQATLRRTAAGCPFGSRRRPQTTGWVRGKTDALYSSHVICSWIVVGASVVLHFWCHLLLYWVWTEGNSISLGKRVCAKNNTSCDISFYNIIHHHHHHHHHHHQHNHHPHHQLSASSNTNNRIASSIFIT